MARPAYIRISLYVSGIAAGICAWNFISDGFATDDSLQDFFVTIYSILVGFLVAVLAMLLDPGVLLRGSWRIAHLQRKEMVRRFTRHLFIFYAYLLTLGAILLLKLDAYFIPVAVEYISRSAAFLAVASFVWSFDLPIALFIVQRDKFDAVVKSREG